MTFCVLKMDNQRLERHISQKLSFNMFKYFKEETWIRCLLPRTPYRFLAWQSSSNVRTYQVVPFQFCHSTRPNFIQPPSFFNQGILRALGKACLPCVISSLLNPTLQYTCMHACPTDNNCWITTLQILITICKLFPNVSTGRYIVNCTYMHKYKLDTRFAICPTLNVR
jgi:hypothetical protein